MANLHALLRDARRNHAEGDDGAAVRSLSAYYEARMGGAIEPTIAGDVAALDLLRAISDSSRCASRHLGGYRVEVADVAGLVADLEAH